MKYQTKIIALDLDDTLLKTDLSISDYTTRILQKAADSGIYIVLCSGRTNQAIFPHVKRIGMENRRTGRFMIAENGAAIYDMSTNQCIYQRFVDPEILVEAAHVSLAEGLTCEVYSADTIYTPLTTQWVQQDVNLSGLKIENPADYDSFLRARKSFKMIIPGDPKKISALEPVMRNKFGSRCVVFTSKPYFLEILPPESGKGEALEWLCDSLKIPRENAMAFGDSMNDESMIRYAGHSVAMINGLDAIKTQAAHITDFTNDQDGVARFIEDYVL